MKKKAAAKGRSAKHSGTRKHAHHTAKHHPAFSTGTASHLSRPLHPAHHAHPVHTVAKHPHHAKPRALSPGSVACCPAEAVAAAARLAGWAVTGRDVLDLYARCADGPSSGFTIAAALTAGLPCVPIDFAPVDPEEVMPLDRWCSSTADDVLRGPSALVTARAGLILGVDLPGPHAVTVAPDGTWHSWGQLFDPADWPDLVIEEAWAVSFA